MPQLYIQKCLNSFNVKTGSGDKIALFFNLNKALLNPITGTSRGNSWFHIWKKKKTYCARYTWFLFCFVFCFSCDKGWEQRDVERYLWNDFCLCCKKITNLNRGQRKWKRYPWTWTAWKMCGNEIGKQYRTKWAKWSSFEGEKLGKSRVWIIVSKESDRTNVY